MKERLKDACDDAGKQMAHAYARNKLSYDRTSCYRSFHPCDMVYIHDSDHKPGVANKLRKYWSLVQKVLQKLSDWTTNLLVWLAGSLQLM